MIILKISNHLTPKGAYDSKYLATQICYALILQELLQIMPQLESTNYNFSLTKNLNVCAETILSNQEGTFFMNVQDIMGIGTQEEIHLVISSCS